MQWKRGPNGRGVRLNAELNLAGPIGNADGMRGYPRQQAARALSAQKLERLSHGLAKDSGYRRLALPRGRVPFRVLSLIRWSEEQVGYYAVRTALSQIFLARRPKLSKVGHHLLLNCLIGTKLMAHRCQR
jgi:hypothetical protein